MFDLVLNTPLSYWDSIWYYNIGDTRAFLVRRSKSTKLTSKVNHNSFRAWFFSLMLLPALEHPERKTFRLLQIIPIVLGRGHRDVKTINLNFSLGSGLFCQRLNKLPAVKFFTNINLSYYVGQHLTYCSGKIEINEMIKNILKR